MGPLSPTTLGNPAVEKICCNQSVRIKHVSGWLLLCKNNGQWLTNIFLQGQICQQGLNCVKASHVGESKFFRAWKNQNNPECMSPGTCNSHMNWGPMPNEWPIRGYQWSDEERAFTTLVTQGPRPTFKNHLNSLINLNILERELLGIAPWITLGPPQGR